MLYVISKAPFKEFAILHHARVPDRKNLFRISNGILTLDRPEMERRCAEIVRLHFEAVRGGALPVLPAEYDLMTPEERRALFDDRVVAAVMERDCLIFVVPTEILLPEPLNLRYFLARSERALSLPLTSENVFAVVLHALKRSKAASIEKMREFFEINSPLKPRQDI